MQLELNFQEEIWKPIEGYEGLYDVSSLGNIKNIITYRILKPVRNGYGYLRVFLRKNNKTFTLKVHRLVALAFIPNPKNKPQINHKNGIKSDNKVSNLEWSTAKENSKHSFKILKNNYILNKVNGRLPSKSIIQYDLNNNFIKKWPSLKNASEFLNINIGSLHGILNGIGKTCGGFIWKYA